MKRIISLVLVVLILGTVFVACSSSEEPVTEEEALAEAAKDITADNYKAAKDKLLKELQSE